jgi:HlyD family secretion protein
MAELPPPSLAAPSVPARAAVPKAASAPLPERQPARKEIRRAVTVGLVALALLVGGGGAWAAIARLASAVIAPGTLIAESDNKKVQHKTGGIVKAIAVANGDHVEAGEVVVTLDDTTTRANLAIVRARLTEFEAQLARLEAERAVAATVTYPASLAARAADPAVAKVLDGERTLFEARRAALEGQTSQLGERIAQLREQIAGLTAQKTAKEEEIALIESELVGLEDLLEKGHVPVTRVIALKRDKARIEGELGALVSQIATTRGRITETELQVIQVKSDFMEKVTEAIRAAQAELAPLMEQEVAAVDELARTEIRAPRSGRVHEAVVHTVGGVVGPGETLMTIVPDEDDLLVEAKIGPTDIDQLKVGQSATLVVAALDQRTTPILHGHVVWVSPDLSHDEKTGASFYTARLALDKGELDRLVDKQLQPGMPVEAFIATGEKSVLDYLVEPLLKNARHALREG